MIKNKMKREIIDCHCHIYPEKIAAKAVESIGKFYDIPMDNNGTIADMLQMGANAGITHYIVFSVATTPHQVKSINEFIARTVAEHDGIMTGLGTLHPYSEDIHGDVEHLLELGLKGVKLHPDIQGIAIDDPQCLKICEEIQGKIPLLLHTGDYRYDYSNPNRLKTILEMFPELTVIGAHFGGWSIWEEAAMELCRYKNLMVDSSSSLYALKPEKAAEIVRMYGAERVLFATDYPMWRPDEELERFFNMGLTDEENEMILYKNARKLFLD